MGGSRGGYRANAGRPSKKSKAQQVVDGLPLLTPEIARDLYQDKSTRERWQTLRDSPDQWLRFNVEKEISHQACGKPRESMELKHSGSIDLSARRKRVGEYLARMAGKAQ